MIHEANTDLMGAVGNLLNRCTGVILNPHQEFPPFQDSFLLCDDCKKLMSATEALPGGCIYPFGLLNYDWATF